MVARDNVIVRLCSFVCNFNKPLQVLAEENPEGEEAVFINALQDWKNHAKQIYIWDYATNFHNYLQPFIHLHTMAENIRYFKREGVRGVLEQGNFAYGGGASMDDLKSYIIGRLLWNPDTDVDDEMQRFFTASYGKEAGKYIGQYVELMEKACADDKLFIKQYPDAQWITDELVEQADMLFKKAMAVAEGACLERIRREHLAVRYLQLTRMELGAANRDALIDAFIDDVKRFGITEIMERNSLAFSKQCMKESRYTRDREKKYKLYYIMQ